MIGIREIMTPRGDLITVLPTTLISESARLMSENHIRHIPVIDESSDLVGMVSHRDILAATAPKAPWAAGIPDNRPVTEIMSSPVMTVDPRVSVLDAGLRLRSLGVGSLAVVLDGELEGIVTDSDFLVVAINLLEQLDATEPVEEF
jgi:CBS domain-containing membrane protein